MTIEEVARAYELKLMSLPGVEGVGVGADPLGNPAVIVYVSRKVQGLPKELEGFAVQVEDLRGPIEAL